MDSVLTSKEKLEIINKGTIPSNLSRLSCKLKIELKNHQISMINAMKALEKNRLKLDDDSELETWVGVCRTMSVPESL